MARTASITYEDLDNISLSIFYNQKMSDGKYAPFIIQVKMDAKSNEGDVETFIQNFEPVARVDTPRSNRQLYNQTIMPTTGPTLGAYLKQVAQAAIAEDISL